MKTWLTALLLVALLLPWSAPHALAAEPQASAMPEMSVYYLALLYKGSAWTSGSTPEVRQLQEQHLANIQRLIASGKMVLAGPFEGSGDLLGIFLLQASTPEEAQELCQSDPAIKAGRIRAEVHRWWGPKGIRVDTAPAAATPPQATPP